MESLNSSICSRDVSKSQPNESNADINQKLSPLESRTSEVGQGAIANSRLRSEDSDHLGEVLERLENEKKEIEGRISFLTSNTSGVKGFFHKIFSFKSFSSKLASLDNLKESLDHLKSDIDTTKNIKNNVDYELTDESPESFAKAVSDLAEGVKLFKRERKQPSEVESSSDEASVSSDAEGITDDDSLASTRSNSPTADSSKGEEEVVIKPRLSDEELIQQGTGKLSRGFNPVADLMNKRAAAPGKLSQGGGALGAMLAKRAQGEASGLPKDGGVESGPPPVSNESSEAVVQEANRGGGELDKVKKEMNVLRRRGLPDVAIENLLTKKGFSKELIQAALSGASSSISSSQEAGAEEDIRKFSGEPDEPQGVSSSWGEAGKQIKNSTKEQLGEQISKIRDYIADLAKSLDPVNKAIVDLKDKKEILKNQEEAVSHINDVIKNRQSVIKQLAESQDDFMMIDLKNPNSPNEKTIRIPCFSESKLEESNSLITNERRKIPDTCLISNMKLSLEQELERGLPDRSGRVGSSLLQQRDELVSQRDATKKAVRDLESSQSNGIPISEFEKVLKVKEQKIEGWRSALSRRETALRDFDKAGSSSVSSSDTDSVTSTGSSNRIKDEGVDAYNDLDQAGLAFLRGLNPNVISDKRALSSKESGGSTMGEALRKGVEANRAKIADDSDDDTLSVADDEDWV